MRAILSLLSASIRKWPSTCSAQLDAPTRVFVSTPGHRSGRTDANRVAFELATIEFGALKDKPSKLANAGLLLATLFQGEAEIVQVSMLTQIDKAADGALTRVIYDPLQ